MNAGLAMTMNQGFQDGGPLAFSQQTPLPSLWHHVPEDRPRIARVLRVGTCGRNHQTCTGSQMPVLYSVAL